MSIGGGVRFREDGRTPTQSRPVSVELDVQKWTSASVVIRVGGTHVLCAATIEDRIPPHLRGKGTGWITAEYSMLPGATAANWIDRADKELYRAKSSGRNRVCIDQPVLVEVSAEEKSQLFVDFSQNDSIWSDSLFAEPVPEVADTAPQSECALDPDPGATPPQSQAVRQEVPHE